MSVIPVGHERDPRRALEKGRAVLVDPARLTHSHTARTANGQPCLATSKAAVRWNMSGALMRVTGRRSRCPGSALLVAAAGGFRAFVELETRGGHAAIVAAFDRAIALLAAGSEPSQKGPGERQDHVHGG